MSMTHPLIFPFQFLTLWICCFTHHFVRSGRTFSSFC